MGSLGCGADCGCGAASARSSAEFCSCAFAFAFACIRVRIDTATVVAACVVAKRTRTSVVARGDHHAAGAACREPPCRPPTEAGRPKTWIHILTETAIQKEKLQETSKF